MNTHNSQVLQMWHCLTSTCTKVSVKTITNVANRATSGEEDLFTSKLPAIGKHFLASLEAGKVINYEGKKTKNGSPVLFQEYYKVFFNKSGVADTTVTAARADYIRELLQLTMFAYKAVVASDTDAEVAAWERFKAVNAEIASTPFRTYQWLRDAKAIIHSLLCNVDPHDIRPRHGNGAVAEGSALRSSVRWQHSRLSWPAKLDDVYSYSEYAQLLTQVADEHSESCFTENIPARVTFVPKDSRGPRMICCEPASNQYIQQGIMGLLYKTMEIGTFIGLSGRREPLSNYIRLQDQSFNSDLARIGSIDRSLCTIDLEAASDRVSRKLVHYLFPRNWVEAMEACRSSSAKYGDDEINLETWAPMGSSYCFPVETLVFWAITYAASQGNFCAAYGDDIVVLKEHFTDVWYALTNSGFVVNSAKSYYKSHFRESCGGQYYGGYDVSFARYKYSPDLETPVGMIRTIAFSQNVIDRYGEAFYYKRNKFGSFADAVDPFRRIPASLYSCATAITGVTCMSGMLSRKRRYNRSLQRYEACIRGVRTPRTHVDGWEGILRSLLLSDRPVESYSSAPRLGHERQWVAIPA